MVQTQIGYLAFHQVPLYQISPYSFQTPHLDKREVHLFFTLNNKMLFTKLSTQNWEHGSVSKIKHPFQFTDQLPGRLWLTVLNLVVLTRKSELLVWTQVNRCWSRWMNTGEYWSQWNSNILCPQLVRAFMSGWLYSQVFYLLFDRSPVRVPTLPLKMRT